MTDQIELPTVPQSPPIIRLDGYGEDADSVILFDRDAFKGEFVVNLRIRDENRTETLKMRWKIESRARPPVRQREYPCPGEPEIPGDGSSLIRETRLTVPGDSLPIGTCNRVDVIVSASFKTCKPDRDEPWDITTQEDDDDVVGRYSFWVWAYNEDSNPSVLPAAAIALLTSCEQLEYQPPSAITTPTPAATTGM